MSKTVTTTELTQQIDAVVARKDSLLRGLSQTQALWRPQPGAWSIAECLDHLNRTSSMYLKLMRVTFERERHNASLPPKAFRLSFFGRKFAGYLEPPYRVKVKAPQSVVPESQVELGQVNAEFDRLRLDLRGFVLEAGRVDMGAISFASPFASILKLNLAEASVIMLAHDRRHLWQAENVRQHPQFPQAE
jgi:hypothetical protein